MKFKLLILLMILLSCEEIPAPGGTDTGCTGNYILEPFDDETEIKIIQEYEHGLILEFFHNNECIEKYHITRLSSNGSTFSDVIIVDENSSSSITYVDENAIIHGLTYFYTISGEDTFGNLSNNLSSNITPSFLGQISEFSVQHDATTNQSLTFSWNFEEHDYPESLYEFEIQWKNGDDQENFYN